MGEDAEYLRMMEIQRRNFEAQFGSIEEMGFEDKTKVSDTESLSSDEVEEDDDEDGSDDEDVEEESDESHDYESEEDFQGFDEPQETQRQPTVIKFKDTTRTYTQPTREQKKLLKSGKAPSLTKPIKPKVPDTKEDKDNLDNDLELQRFLQESHILSNFQSQNSGADLTLQTIDNDGPIGDARKHTLNSRLKNLSSTNGVKKSKLEKMPMHIRKGMVQSRVKKIAKFEQDAKEGGIVLSKVKKGEFRNIGGSVTLGDRIGDGLKNKKGSYNKHRERGLKINSVGKSTRNGLVISQSTIDRINGTGDKKRGKKRGGR